MAIQEGREHLPRVKTYEYFHKKFDPLLLLQFPLQLKIVQYPKHLLRKQLLAILKLYVNIINKIYLLSVYIHRVQMEGLL